MALLGIFVLLLPFIVPTLCLRNDLKRGTSELLILSLALVTLFVALTLFAPGFLAEHGRHSSSARPFRRLLDGVGFRGWDQERFFEQHGRYGSADEIYGESATDGRLEGISFYVNDTRDHWCLYAPVDMPPYEFCVIFADDRDRLGLIFAPWLKGTETVAVETAYADGPFSEELRVELKEPRHLYDLRQQQLYRYRVVPAAIVLSVLVLVRLVLRLRGVRRRTLLAVDWAVCLLIGAWLLLKSLVLFA